MGLPAWLDPLHLGDRAEMLIRRDATLGTLFERLARLRPNRMFVDEDAGPNLNLTQAADRVAAWAGAIAERVSPGDVVVVATPNGVEQLLVCLAASRAGAIPAPVNPQMHAEEVDHVVADSGATLVVRDLHELDGVTPLAQAVPAHPDDLAALFYTSGTTGKPKGVKQTHRALLGTLLPAVAAPTGVRRDLAVVGLPVAHIMGFIVVLGLACAGVPMRFVPHFNPLRVLDIIEDERATAFIGVPAMYRMLLEAGAEQRDLRSVRVWGSGADVMPGELADRFKKMGASASLPLVGSVGEAIFAEGYGLVETGGGVVARLSPPLVSSSKVGSLGRVLPGNEVRVVDEDGRVLPHGEVGELQVKGRSVTAGYHGDADATSAALTDDGWLRTGDLARLGPLGTVAFAGRSKDVVKVGGYSVYAVEVERALEEHPDVLEAAVVGIPDERLGEVAAAAVRVRARSTLTPEGLIAWARAYMAEYKAPREVRIVDELPRTGTRKVRRRHVAELFD